MVRRMTEAGHVKSIKIPDVFLQESKPLASTAPAHTPVLPYLAMARFAKERENEIREAMTMVKGQEEKLQQESNPLSSDEADKPHIDAASIQLPQQAPQYADSQQDQLEMESHEPNYFRARPFTSRPISWSDRQGTSAPLPNETQALALRQGVFGHTATSAEGDGGAAIAGSDLNPTTHSPQRRAVGEVYINEQGRRVRLVKKHRPPKTDANGSSPGSKQRKPRINANGAPNSSSKSKGSRSTNQNGSSCAGTPKKRRKKPRSTASITDFPTSIGIPTDFEERSVQSELNMLSLGDLTPMEVSKMDPPSQSFDTAPETPDNSTCRTAGSTPSSVKRTLFGNHKSTNHKAVASAGCGCVIS